MLLKDWREPLDLKLLVDSFLGAEQAVALAFKGRNAVAESY